jgi:hypothetical protein
MKMTNHSPDPVKRTDAAGRWVVLQPGDSMEIDDKEAAYLMKAEARIWTKPKPMKKGGDE